MFLLLAVLSEGLKKTLLKILKEKPLPSKKRWQNSTEFFMKRVHCNRLIQKSTYCTAKWLVHFPALPNAWLYTYYLVKVHCILKKVIVLAMLEKAKLCYSCACEVGTFKYNPANMDSLIFAIIFVKFLVNFVEYAILIFVCTFLVIASKTCNNT